MIQRIRTVKPELFSHPLLCHLETVTGWPMRLYYEVLWTFCDREGRFEWKPDVIRLGMEPYKALDVERVLNTFANTGFTVKYQVGVRTYGWVPRFLVHQNINGRERPSELPPPPAGAEAWHEARLVNAEFTAIDAETLGARPRTLGMEALAINRDSAATSEGVRGNDTNHENGGVYKRSPQHRKPQRVARRLTAHLQNRTEQNRTEQNREEHSSSGERSTRTPEGAAVAQDDTLTPVAAVSASSPPEDAPSVGVALSAERSAALVVVRDDWPARALPSLRERSAAALIERLGVVLHEVSLGARERLKKEQQRILQADLVFGYWASKHEHPHAIPDQKRTRRILDRLRENRGNVSELCYAIDGALKDDWLMGRDEHSTRKYDDLHHILRDRSQVERLASLCRSYQSGVEHKIVEKYRTIITEHTNGGHHHGDGIGEQQHSATAPSSA